MHIRIIIFSLILLGCTGFADAATGAATPASCAAVRAPAGVIFDASPRWVEAGTIPAHCEIRAVIDGRLHFVMRLPAAWQGRFLLAGCGGFCGELLPDKEGYSNTINVAVRRGYAAIAHDGGHRAPSWDTAWARDREALEIWSHKLLPMLTNAGTELAKSVYGTPPKFKYYSGCSNGGRLGLAAAQRYPGLFDGIAAGASVADLSGTAGLWGNWTVSRMMRDGKPVLPTERWKVVREFVLQRCDALDGRRDGRVDAPRNCKVDFAELATRDGGLEADQAAALNALYGGVRNVRGEIVYPTLEYGSEIFAEVWLAGSAERPGWGILASDGYRRLLSASVGESVEGLGTSVEAMQSLIARSPVPAMTDATNPDLRPFARKGGKLLIYHGLADPLIIPKPIEDYYAAAARKAGGIDRLRKNARLFMVPGWGHCWERPSPTGDDFDPLTALESWVERGEAPQSLRLRSRDDARSEAVPMR